LGTLQVWLCDVDQHRAVDSTYPDLLKKAELEKKEPATVEMTKPTSSCQLICSPFWLDSSSNRLHGCRIPHHHLLPHIGLLTHLSSITLKNNAKQGKYLQRPCWFQNRIFWNCGGARMPALSRKTSTNGLPGCEPCRTQSSPRKKVNGNEAWKSGKAKLRSTNGNIRNSSTKTSNLQFCPK